MFVLADPPECYLNCYLFIQLSSNHYSFHLFNQPAEFDASYTHGKNALSFPPSCSGTQTVIFFPLCCHQPPPLLGFLLFKSTTTRNLFPPHILFEWGRRHDKIKKIMNFRGRSEFNFWLCQLPAMWPGVHAVSCETLISKIKAKHA